MTGMPISRWFGGEKGHPHRRSDCRPTLLTAGANTRSAPPPMLHARGVGYRRGQPSMTDTYKTA